MSIPLEQSTKVDLQNIVLPSQLSPTYTNAPTIKNDAAAPVAEINNTNNGRAATATQNIGKIDDSLKKIDQQQNPEDAPDSNPGNGSPSLMGKFAMAAVGVVATAALPIPAPVSAALNVPSAISLGTATYSKLRSKDDGQKNDDTSPGYIGAPVEGTFDYVRAIQEQRSNPVNASKDVAAFKNAQGKMASGAAGITERSAIASTSLAPEDPLDAIKVNLERQREICLKSFENAGEVKAALNNRRENGVQVNGNTVEAAIRQDQSFDKLKSGVIFNV